MKVLVVEDDFSISSALTFALEREGYTVRAAADGEEALEIAEAFKPDVIILDIMLPKMNGYEVFSKLNHRKERPGVLLLTVKNDIVDKVLGLELGADDYMTKPFDIREVLARVKALYRRKKSANSNNSESEKVNVEWGGLSIELYSRTVKLNGRELDLTPKEFDLLVELACHPDRVYCRKMLLNKVWDINYAGGTRTVDIHIQRLRKKLGSWQGLIQTINGIGYKIILKPLDNEKTVQDDAH